MMENTQISMETIIQVYSVAIVLASQSLYNLNDVNILSNSIFVGDFVDRIQQKLDKYTIVRNPNLTINKSLFAHWIKNGKKKLSTLKIVSGMLLKGKEIFQRRALYSQWDLLVNLIRDSI